LSRGRLVVGFTLIAVFAGMSFASSPTLGFCGEDDGGIVGESLSWTPSVGGCSGGRGFVVIGGTPPYTWSLTPYVTVRVRDDIFHLVDGQEAEVDWYYVFLARATQRGGIGLIAPQAIYSAGCLDGSGKESIRDAAMQLTEPKIRIF